ncbi:unnamed protein product [marine sediment metagenome]|uniref:Uncharacterized protein n=1 Tax=marine sediment metagenome TaxID=412755 RepID=X1SL92_9ZZZZ
MKKPGFISAKRISPGCVEATYTNRQDATAQAAEAFFIANEACEVVAASESHSAAEESAATLGIDIVKEASGDAAGESTTSVLATTFDGKGTADTPQRKAGSDTLANKQLAKGDRLSFKPSAAGTELTGVIITVQLKYI